MATESPTNDFGKAAKGAKSAVGFVQKTRQFIKVASMAIKGATGPAGWAVAAAQLLAPLINKIKKAAAIVGGIIALKILMHIMQIVGLITGLAFGAISGLPLLLVPVAGPFLYAGWVGFWAYKGFTDPFATIQLATHPWELVTRPLGWAGEKLSNLGSYFKGGTDAIGSGASNVVSSAFYTAGNFVTGVASSLWGWTTSLIGNTAGWLGGVAGNVFGAASATLTSSASSIIVVAVKITATTLGVGSLLVATTNIVALSTTEGDLAEKIGTTPGINEYFTITKTTNSATLQNTDLPRDITFQITLTAKTQSLTSINFQDQTILTTASGNISITPTADTCATTKPAILAPATPWSCTITISATTTPSAIIFLDSTLNNTATVTATAQDGTSRTGAATVSVAIGTQSTICNNIQLIDGTAAWSDAEKNNIQAVCTTLARAPSVVGLINSAGTVQIIKNSGGLCGGETAGNIITITTCDFSNLSLAHYVTIHELGHVIANFNYSVYQAFLNSGAYESEGLIPTYPYSISQITWCQPQCESFPEMITDYVVSMTHNYPPRNWGVPYPGGPWNNPGSGFATFKNDKPIHYGFAKSNIFGGVEF